MKNGLISLLLSISGIVLVLYFNNLVYEVYVSQLLEKIEQNQTELSNGIEFPYAKKQIGYGVFIGIVAFYFAFKQYKEKKWIGIVVGLIAILLICLDFVPFWKFQLGDSTLDINLGNR